jgi:hypothetical protein
MDKFIEQGKTLREQAKKLVLSFMAFDNECHVSGSGIKQAQIFKRCGFDWGNYEKATSSNQQYWIVGLLRELEAEGKVEQVRISGPWRLKNDSINNQTNRERPLFNNASGEKHTKINRIKLWANRPYQDNHKIIMAYLHLEKNGAVQLSDLKNLCSNKSNNHYFVEKFDGHYASMKTDKGNSHGKVFYDQNGIVYIWPIVREEIKIHFKNG